MTQRKHKPKLSCTKNVINININIHIYMDFK